MTTPDLNLLDNFDPSIRRAALADLASRTPAPPVGGNVNMHLHSFFSFNAQGWSPTRIAWEARQGGLYAAALCDFDVLDGMAEFLDAALTLGLRAAAHLETRAYLREFADAEINSPGEPGVTYIMGMGFTRIFPDGTPQAATLAALRAGAAERNRALAARINPHLGPAAVDYERDVVPLSPGGCPTERHLMRAYVDRARIAFPDPAALAAWWAQTLGVSADEAVRLLEQRAALENRARAKLAKRGGVGYAAPTPGTFPPADDFVAWVRSCDAIPTVTWLDGTSRGESSANAMLDCLEAKGCAAANIIPERNWNYRDPAVKAVKTAKLREFVEACASRHLPVNIGTEMNSDGLPFADDLDGEALRPYREIFRQGAAVMVGHTLLARYADFPYPGAAAQAEFGADRAAKNRFFASAGNLPPLTTAAAARLQASGPQKALAAFRSAVRMKQTACIQEKK